jgi:hypothetical protein
MKYWVRALRARGRRATSYSDVAAQEKPQATVKSLMAAWRYFMVFNRSRQPLSAVAGSNGVLKNSVGSS